MPTTQRSKLPTFTVTAALLAAGLAAQGAEVAARMRPAPELRKLEPMVGSYQGSGTMLPSAGAKPLAWTARTNVRWALGGFALHEEAAIEFAGDSVPPLHFTSYLGYDRDGKRYVMGSASRMGVQMRPCWILANPAAADGDSDCCPIFVSTSSGTMDGEPYVDHDVTRFGTDGYEFVVTRVMGKGGPFEHARGTFKRSKDGTAVAPPKAAAKAGSPEMAKLDRLIGTWRVTGSMTMQPGQAAMPIAGTETCSFGFGGNVLCSHVEGDPMPGGGASYEMFGFLAFDAAAGKYVQLAVDSMGTIGRSEGAFTSADQLVFTDASPYLGAPSAARLVLQFRGDGDGEMTVTSERLHGAAPALRDFEGHYRRAK